MGSHGCPGEFYTKYTILLIGHWNPPPYIGPPPPNSDKKNRIIKLSVKTDRLFLVLREAVRTFLITGEIIQ